MGFRDSDTIIEPIDDGGAFDSGEGSTSSTSESAANALAAANSAAAALVSENNAADDVALTAADVVLTNADVVLTHADVVLTAADKVQTGLDRVATNAHVVLTNADVVLAEADKVQTGLDRIAVAADLVLTNQDTIDTAADVLLTNADVVLTHADVVLTHADVVLAEADKVQTGLDRAAVAADLVLTNQDTIDTAADVVLTHADVVLTHADVILAEADKVQTGLDRIAVAADLVLTNQDTIDTAADVLLTNADVVLTNADVVLTHADVVLAEADKVQTGLDRTATTNSATSAANSASTATTKASEASTSATNAATSESTATTKASEASTSATNAATSATAAETAETNAETAETNAAASQSSASGSASTATTKASEASASATSASTSASTATTKASEASTSATNAATSATNAATSEANAETAETNAETAETNAETAETNALASKNAAATSETNSSNSATASANSASSAATSETNAATSASTASSQASTATTKASEASTSATNAATSASTATTKASEASTSATNAATSASNSASSATAAQTAETNAETAETNAAASATTATTKAGEALTSANSSASSASTATAAKDAALAALDSFDDRYLGAKSSDPTVDNDGNALISGALYFNTTDDAMKVYTGSAWVAAYASLSGALLATNNLSDLDNAVSARSNLGLVIGTNVQAFSAILAATTASYTTGLNTKLSNIETGATADQTGAEIKTAYQAEANAFTDSLYTKLYNIEALADVTDTANVVSSLTAGSNITIAADGTISGSAAYSLPTSSPTVLGGVKVGTNLSISGTGVLSSTNTTYSGGTGISLTGTTFAINSSYTGFDGRYYTETESDTRFVNVAGDTMTGALSFGSQTGTWISSSAMADSIGWNTTHGVYIGSDIGGTHYLRGNGKFTTGGNTYNLFHEGYHPNADKWTIARTLSLTGDVTGSVSWDGSANASLSTVVGNDSHTHSISTITDEHRLFNNMGDNHGTRTDFNATYDFGWRYVQGNTNGPGTGGSNYYSTYAGLGNEYPYTQYGMQIAYPRAATTPYISIRYKEASAWGSWQKISAGQADKWTTARTLTLTGDASGSTTWDGSGNASISVTVNNDSHTHHSLTPSSGTTSNYLRLSSSNELELFNSSNNVIDLYLNYSGGSTSLRGPGGSVVWHDGNDGSGSGLDADLLDGFNSSQGESANTVAVRSSAGYLFSNYFNGSGTFSTTGATSGMARFTGTNGTDTYGRSYTAAAARALLNVADGANNYSLPASPTVTNLYVGNAVYHDGDTDTYMAFGTNNISLVAGGHAEITIDTTGVRLGDTGNGYFQPVSGNYGSIQIYGGAHGAWEGYSIGGRFVFMHDNSTAGGIFNDVENEWFIYCVRNAETRMYYNGISKIETTSVGAVVNGKLNLYGTDGEKLILSGATQPYIEFQEGSTNKANIQWNSGGFLAFNNRENGQFRFTSSIEGYSTDLILIRNDSVTASEENLGSINFGHNDGTHDFPSQTVIQLPARIVATATETTGDGDDGARLDFYTKSTNADKATTTSLRMRIDSNGYTEMYTNFDMNDYDIYGVDQIFHHGDTNTYMQFHEADQWRVVTGGVERLEVNNSQITSTEPIYAPSFHGNGSSLTGVLPPLLIGDVGTYALLRDTSNAANVGPGITKAGSGLRFGNTYQNGANYGSGSNAASGTWRLMGHTGIYNATIPFAGASTSASVWVRIS